MKKITFFKSREGKFVIGAAAIIMSIIIILSIIMLMWVRSLEQIYTVDKVVEHVEIYERVKVDTKIVEYRKIQKEIPDRVFINAYSKKESLSSSYSVYVYRETEYKENFISWDYTVFNVEDELNKLKSANPDKNYFIKIHLADANNSKKVETISSSYVNTYIQNRKNGLEIKEKEHIS